MTLKNITRRNTLKTTGALVATGSTGCIDEGSTTSDDSVSNGSSTGDASYEACMQPSGCITFDSPPETVFTRLTHHAGMMFALGRADDVNAMHAPDYYDRLWNQFVERLPGVSLDWSGLYSSWKPTKEKLYELDSDVHLADPAWIAKQDAWGRDDIEEIGENVSPWFGNSLSDTHQEPPKGWKGGYEYYTLWEQFGIVAEAFQEEERYEELAAVHDELLSTIEDGLPSETDRQSAVMIASQDMDEIYAYTLSDPGFLNAQTRPLKPRDAFDGAVESGTTVDSETLLEADPDVILFLGGFEPETSLPERREIFRSDPVFSEITAVRNERVHPQGARYQGPILNLFQLEMTAKQLYPEVFGEWPTYEEGPYPEISEDERMFDRQRVADIVNGEV